MKKVTSVAGLVLVALVTIILGLLSIRYANPTAPSIPTSGAKTTATPRESYVALGDSIAAGVGLKDDSDSSACNRTNQAYPNLVAASLNDELTNLACSGATLPAGILGSQEVNKLQVKAQLQQLFARPTPNNISLTIGANDAQWTTVIGKCYTGQCGSAADSAAVAAALVTVSNNLKSALDQIKAHYSSEPRVIITGYHQVFPAAIPGGCTDLSGIDAAELAWGRTLQSSINNALQAVVKPYDFASFAAVDFGGHELCSTDPWVQGLADKQPYHPTAAGQAAFAAQVVSAIKAGKQVR